MRVKHTYLRPFVGDWPILQYLKQHLSNQQAHKQKDKGCNTEDAVEDDSDFPPVRIARESSDEDGDSSNNNGDDGGDK